MTLHQRMKALRMMRGMTQDELAQKTGIAQPYISLMELGKVTPAGEWETKIKTALNWTPEVDAKLDELTEA